MRLLLLLPFVLAAVLLNIGCMGCTNIEPGHVGVMIKKCSGGGVQSEPLNVGWQFRNIICEEIEEYPTYQVTLILTKSEHEGTANNDEIIVNSSEGLPIGMDVSVSLTLDPKRVPAIYSKYRMDIEHILNTYIKQTVREALQETSAKYTAEQLYSVKRAETRAEVQTFLKDRLVVDGFNITQFTINELRPPQQVVDAINAKVAMIQQALKAEQEVKKTEAEAKQRAAKAEGDAQAKRIEADAESYYNLKVSNSITDQLVRMKAIEKWDGVMPHVQGGGATPFIQIPTTGTVNK